MKDNKEAKESSKEPFKKFQFFDKIDQEDDNEAEIERRVKYSLNDFTPTQMKAINKFIFMIGTHQSEGLKEENEGENILIKVYKNKVIDEYRFFNKQFCFIHLYEYRHITYLTALGVNESEDPNKPKTLSLQLKIYNFSNCLNKSACDSPILINSINVNEKDSLIPDIKLLSAFAINDTNTMAAIGLSTGKVILITSKGSFEDNSPREIKYLTNKAMEERVKDGITNIQFCYVNNIQTLVYTTVKEVFAYKLEKGDDSKKKDKDKENIIEIISEPGIHPFCFDVSKDKTSIAYANDTSLGLYDNYLKKGPQWSIEGSIKHLSFFNDFIVLLSLRNMEYILQIFDQRNEYFAYFENSFDTILLFACDNDNVYALFDTYKGKEVRIYQEKDNKEKFETFYKKGFYDTAYNYAKTLKYDGKTLAEISNRHAKYLYRALEYEKSIKEYIKTINYLDPSYVIQDFLDGSKLDYLIYYLEALHENDLFKQNCPREEMKDYTALLLNCYIKQKQLDKLKDFLEKIDTNEKLIDIGTAIEVCKESDQTDIALNIATRCQINESSVQILIELKEEYANGLANIIEETNIVKKYKLFLKYGEKLLEKCPNETNAAIQKLLSQIIEIKQGNDENAKLEIDDINYETIIQIYHKKEKDLEKILKFIMEKDRKCPISIIHRQIEVYCKNKNTGGLGNLLTNKEYIDRIDKNYILLLLSTNKSQNEIVLLSEKMNLKHELFQLYIKDDAQNKVIDFCKDTGKDDPSIWVQALAYFILKYDTIVNIDSKPIIEEYIRTIVKQVLDNEIVSPIVLFEVFSQIKRINVALIKDILNNHLAKIKGMYDENKKICDVNYKQIDKLQTEVKELNCKAKLFNCIKCSICSQQLYMPCIFFFCNHAFHPNCLNSELRDNMKKECPICAKAIAPTLLKLNQIENNPVDPNVFFSDLVNKPKKNDLIAQYLSKGIFKMDEY